MQLARTVEARNDDGRVVFAATKAALKTEIRASKNAWGEAYRVVMAKTIGIMAHTKQSPDMLEGIIDRLFPRHDPSPWSPFAGDEERVTDMELAGIAKSYSVGKAPGPDGVPNLALKVAIAEAPEMLRSALRKCLNEGAFPEVWKWQRPIYLIDTVGRVLDKIILNKLLRAST